MLFNKHLGNQVLNLETMEYEDDSVLVCYGGGGKSPGAPAPAPQPLIAPTPPVEEAGVDMEDEATKQRKDMSGKSSLKIPLATNSLFGSNDKSTTGLKV